jgi:hypothetical protein
MPASFEIAGPVLRLSASVTVNRQLVIALR